MLEVLQQQTQEDTLKPELLLNQGHMLTLVEDTALSLGCSASTSTTMETRSEQKMQHARAADLHCSQSTMACWRQQR